MLKIVFTDAESVIDENLSLDKFKNLGEITVYDYTPDDLLVERVKDADIVICNKTIINSEKMKVLPKLKYIGLFATGYNNIDVKYAKEAGITVCNAAGYSTNAVAQHVFAYILNDATKLVKFGEDVKNGSWLNCTSFCNISNPTTELYGKTIGIVGYGAIGKKVASIAKAFDMKVIAYSRTKKEADTEYVDFDYLLKNSDYISVHCPLNEETKEIFNIDAFSKCKSTAYFINTARGGVVNENDLKYALENKVIRGAGVDVITNEPMREDCVLRGVDNLIITPHVAWAPFETRERLINLVYENLSAFLEGNPKSVVSV